MATHSRISAQKPESEFIGVTDGANYLNCTRASVYNMINDGRLPAYRIAGKMVRIKRSDLKALIIPVGGAAA